MKNNCQHLNCNLKVFKNKNKCIFHCEKDDWFIINEKNEKTWNKEKVNEFWSKLNSYVISVQKKELESSILGKLTRYDNNGSKELISIENFIIPKLNSIENLSEKLEYYYFDNCTFMDDFIIELRSKDKYLQLDFNFLKSEFKGKLEFRGDLSGVNGSIDISATKHYNDIKFEGNYFKNINLSNINFDKVHTNKNLPHINIEFKVSLVVRYMNFDNIIISYLDNCNINKINFEYTNIKNLDLTKVNKDRVSIPSFSMYNSLIEKCYIANLNINYFTLKNINLKEISQVNLSNISSQYFILDNISQNSKNIKFDTIEIIETFECNSIDFKNTTFNNFDLSECKVKNISNTTFTDSYLNSIKWGNINQINSDRETFRQLKSLNDENSNYIDANNFFVKEMKEYKKELSQRKWSNWWEEKIVFFMNEQISNFGRSWFQSILWLIIISLFFFNIVEEIIKPNLYLQMFFTASIFYLGYKIRNKINQYWKVFKLPFILPHIFILLFLFYITDKSFIDSINAIVHFISPVSYSEYANKGFSFIWALHKSFIAIIIYHFTISVRRQTKR